MFVSTLDTNESVHTNVHNAVHTVVHNCNELQAIVSNFTFCKTKKKYRKTNVLTWFCGILAE